MTATRTKRILSVQPVCDGGGSEHALIRMLRQLASDGWECHVAVPGPARLAEEYAAAGIRLHIVGMSHLTTSGGAGRWLRFAFTWPVSVTQVTRLAIRIGAGVLHTNSLHSWVGWASARLARIPHVWHAREIVFQSDAALRVERFLARDFADVVVAVSEAVASQLDPANVVVITDEADPVEFRPSRAGAFRRSVGIGDSVPLVGSAARFDTWKGFDTLLDAFETVRARRPDAELVVAGAAVAGKEDYAEALHRRAASLPGVHWVGHRRDIAELRADLDVFVAVSSEPEPFGLVVVEALACGIPVVAGAAGGPLEILGSDAAAQPSAAGRLVEPGNAELTAEAILALLPETSGRDERAGRTPLRSPEQGRFVSLFNEVLETRHHERRRRITRSPKPPRPSDTPR